MYGILSICFKISLYLESYYRYDDILAVNNDPRNSTLLTGSARLLTPPKNLEEYILLQSFKYKGVLELILNNLRVVMINIDHYRLEQGCYQMKDYTVVTDRQPLDYRTDD